MQNTLFYLVQGHFSDPSSLTFKSTYGRKKKFRKSCESPSQGMLLQDPEFSDICMHGFKMISKQVAMDILIF